VSKKTIIDWQRDSLLVAVASAHGNAVAIEQLSEQPIGHTAEGGDELLPLNGDAAQGLVRAIDELGLRKSEVSVILSRDLVEVRTISVPRIDADELPDVIRFKLSVNWRTWGTLGRSTTCCYPTRPVKKC
jgi:Tfp pilus assembly PilM family ATPase